MENGTLQLYTESSAHLKMFLFPVFPQNIQVVPQVTWQKYCNIRYCHVQPQCKYLYSQKKEKFKNASVQSLCWQSLQFSVSVEEHCKFCLEMQSCQTSQAHCQTITISRKVIQEPRKVELMNQKVLPSVIVAEVHFWKADCVHSHVWVLLKSNSFTCSPADSIANEHQGMLRHVPQSVLQTNTFIIQEAFCFLITYHLQWSKSFIYFFFSQDIIRPQQSRHSSASIP